MDSERRQGSHFNDRLEHLRTRLKLLERESVYLQEPNAQRRQVQTSVWTRIATEASPVIAFFALATQY